MSQEKAWFVVQKHLHGEFYYSLIQGDALPSALEKDIHEGRAKAIELNAVGRSYSYDFIVRMFKYGLDLNTQVREKQKSLVESP